MSHVKNHGLYPGCDAKSLEDSKRRSTAVMESWRVREETLKVKELSKVLQGEQTGAETLGEG